MSQICRMTGVRSMLGAASALLTTAAAAWAQISPTPVPSPTLPPGPSPEVTSGTGAILIAAVVIVLLIAVGAMVKLYDLRRKREDEAVALQARISDALMSEPFLAAFPLAPTVRIPMRGSPATIEIVGSVPRPEHRQAAVDLVVREAARSCKSYRVDSRISIDPMMMRRAA